MMCRHCGYDETRVIKTTYNIARNVRVRTRLCLKCHSLIRTVEKEIIREFPKNNPGKRINYGDELDFK